MAKVVLHGQPAMHRDEDKSRRTARQMLPLILALEVLQEEIESSREG
jgi:hypothetical protein